MTRYIGIDSNTGYVFFDTADLDGAARQETPVEAVERFERFKNVRGGGSVEYVEHSRRPNGLVGPIPEYAGGYDIYRAGSDVVLTVENGQDQNTIDEVVKQCDYLGCVEVRTMSA